MIGRYFAALGATRGDVHLGIGDDAALLQTSKDALADLDRLFAADIENESRDATK